MRSWKETESARNDSVLTRLCVVEKSGAAVWDPAQAEISQSPLPEAKENRIVRQDTTSRRLRGQGEGAISDAGIFFSAEDVEVYRVEAQRMEPDCSIYIE